MSSTKFGFSSTVMDVIQGIDLKNRDFIVTGSSSGIGIETVRALAKAGARVVIAVRDVAKGETVAKELRESTKNPNIEVEKLEVDNLTSVRDFVQRYLAKKRPLNGLINNAGIMASPKAYTVDGFESQFGTNHMGHFALTVGLLPALKDGFKSSGKKSRVINLSSVAHMNSDIDFEDVNFKTREYDKWKAYAQSKTATILFSVALTQLYSEQGVVSNAVNPGFILTGIQRDLSREEQIKSGLLDENGNPGSRYKFKSVEQGASTSVWAAVAPELEGRGGLYLEDCNVSKVTTKEVMSKERSGYLDYAVNKESAIKLWDLSKKLMENPPK